MSGMLLVGVVDKEAAAIEIMMGMQWRDRHCVTLTRSLSLSIPQQSAQAHACDVCIVDLVGLGMRKYSEVHEQRLLEFLAGRHAVLLVWGRDSGWAEHTLPLAAGQRVQYLTTPYRSHSLREAISKLLEGQVALQGAKPLVAAKVLPVAKSMPVPGKSTVVAPLPAWRRAEELAKRLQSERDRSAAAPSAPERASLAADGPTLRSPLLAPASINGQVSEPIKMVHRESAGGQGRDAMDALLAMFPSLRAMTIVGLGEKIAARQGPLLLKIGPNAEFVLNFHRGWLACGLSVPALQKLARTPHLAESVHITPLPEDEVESKVRQRCNGKFQRAQIALDEVVWDVLGDAIKGQTLEATGDMRIQLRRFPNVTALSEVGPFDVQLAAICARAPHDVSDLLRAFPRQEQAVLRFVMLATASGLTSVIAQDAQAQKLAAPVARTAQAADPGPQVQAKRGFFKSFLDKLF